MTILWSAVRRSLAAASAFAAAASAFAPNARSKSIAPTSALNQLSPAEAMGAPRVFQPRLPNGVAKAETTSAEDILQLSRVTFTEIDSMLLKNGNVPQHDQGVYYKIQKSLNDILDLCRAFEIQPETSAEEIKGLRESLRAVAKMHFATGPFGKEITSWPRGPGSSTAMNIVYEGVNNLPSYSTKAHYMEWYLRDQALAHAVRSRKNTLRDILRDELSTNSNRDGDIKILDLANGPIQSLKEVFLGQLLDEPLIQRIQYSGYDTDGQVQQSNKQWIEEFGGALVPSAFEFYKESALRAPFTANKSYNLIYSTGFFDYLPDRSLVNLWKRSFNALEKGGSLIISLKDSDLYHSQVYHYFVEWDHFFQRNTSHFEDLLAESGMPAPEKVVRDSTGIILFYIVRKG